ncbi:MAG TPA: glycosyltransferase family 4 protein [Polyangia bacterium]|jgi:glycosyltransferase involved in cell wall biosynthesis
MSEAPVRLLVVDTSPVNSGGAQLLYRYAKYFDPACVRPTMLLHEDNLWAARYRDAGTAEVIVEPGLFQSNTIPPVHEVPLRTWLPKIIGAVGHMTPPFWRMVRAIRERDIDVVMGVCDTPATLAALLGTFTSRPAIMHLVSTYVNRFEPAALELFGHLPAVRRLVMLSRYSARYFERLGPKVTTIYSGIDLADFDERTIAPSLRRPRGLGADVPLIGIAGRFVDVKGMDVFARAAARVAARVPAARFFMLGDDSGAYGAEVHRLVRELGLEDRVVFTGFVDDMHAALADLDVVVVPSRRESAPLVVYESMALGKPVVASRVHGLPELVEDGVTGLLAPVEDDAAVAEAVVALLGDPARRRAMGQAGAQRIRARFNLRHATAELQGVICDAAAARRARA